MLNRILFHYELENVQKLQKFWLDFEIKNLYIIITTQVATRFLWISKVIMVTWSISDLVWFCSTVHVWWTPFHNLHAGCPVLTLFLKGCLGLLCTTSEIDQMHSSGEGLVGNSQNPKRDPVWQLSWVVATNELRLVVINMNFDLIKT